MEGLTPPITVLLQLLRRLMAVCLKPLKVLKLNYHNFKKPPCINHTRPGNENATTCQTLMDLPVMLLVATVGKLLRLIDPVLPLPGDFHRPPWIEAIRRGIMDMIGCMSLSGGKGGRVSTWTIQGTIVGQEEVEVVCRKLGAVKNGNENI